MWRIRTAVLLVLVALATSCSGEGDEATTSATTTREPPSTTTTTTKEDPESAFYDQLDQRLDYEPAFAGNALSMAENMCAALDIIYNEASAGTSLENKDELAGLGLDEAMNTGLDDEVTALVFVVGAENLCPDLSAAVARYLEARGLPHT